MKTRLIPAANYLTVNVEVTEPSLRGLVRARLRCLCTTNRVVDALGGWRIIGKLVRRATWADNQLPSAVWALPTKHIFGTRSAERALEGTDPCLRGIRGQITITALTARPQLEHAARLSLNGITFDARGCRRQVPLTEGLALYREVAR